MLGHAAIGNTACTSNSDCTISSSECDTLAGTCRCLANYYDDGTYCQPSKYAGMKIYR